MPCPFTGPKMFCVGPNILSQPKNLTAFSASSKTFMLAQKPILLNANHLFVWHKIFVTATICKWIFGLAQKIWTSPKHFGTCKRTRHKLANNWQKYAQNPLNPRQTVLTKMNSSQIIDVPSKISWSECEFRPSNKFCVSCFGFCSLKFVFVFSQDSALKWNT